MIEPSVRITTGETVTVGGVPVTVEVDEGELVIRVGRGDASAEGAPAFAGNYGMPPRGHVTVRVSGEQPGADTQHRFSLYAKEDS